jgi:membrane protein implicated in regulation of membrane protease activity
MRYKFGIAIFALLAIIVIAGVTAIKLGYVVPGFAFMFFSSYLLFDYVAWYELYEAEQKIKNDNNNNKEIK